MRCHLWMNVKDVMREIFKFMSIMVVIMIDNCFINELWMDFSFCTIIIFRVDIRILRMAVMAMIMLMMVFNVMYLTMMIFMMMFSIVYVLQIFI